MTTKNKDMTPEILEAVMKTMPEKLTGYQLSAFLMLLTDTYTPEQSNGISLLLTSGVTYARSCGMTPEQIAKTLRDVATHVETTGDPLIKRKVH